MYLSIVSPVYAAETILPELVRRIKSSVEPLGVEYEIVLVEDASPDNSWNIIEQLAANDKCIVGVKLSRNFGQHNAISAGLEAARGDYVVVMDCDLQHDPADIPRLINSIRQGYDLVYTRTPARPHGIIKNLTARAYYWVLSHLSDYDMDPNIGTYSILSRKVVDAYNRYTDYRKAYLWVLRWIGFSYTTIDINYSARYSGTTNYSPIKLIKHALNVTISNSDRLLYISVFLGMFFSLLSSLGILIIMIKYFITGGFEGWSSMMVTLMFFSGLILMSLGCIGIYIAKVFEQTKGRPRYLVSKYCNYTQTELNAKH